MRLAIVGLNPGTAIYAQYLARDGHDVTIYTETQDDVKIMDLVPHALLGIVNEETTKLFTRKYLEDLLGIRIVNARLQSVVIDKNDVVLNDQGTKYHYDRVIVGSEAVPRESGDCGSVYRITLQQGNYIINGNDIGKNTESLLLITDMGGHTSPGLLMALDDDVLKSLPVSRTQGIETCITTDYGVIKPIVSGTNGGDWMIGRGFITRDPLSGIEYTINRDHQLIMMGKLLALRDLGIIDSLPLMPRLETGFSINWSYLSIGLTKRELSTVFRDLSSSRITYRADDVVIIAKALHRGSKPLGIQILTRGIKLLNWYSSIYTLVMLGKSAYLMLDMGYERAFNVVRGILEQLLLNLHNI
ncbi:hypothetical protein [Vulcanisaeta souniana]|nr:hypothetical protein [Vulcanisaeta souniana]BDR91929.1 hypothetical protein Vsou_10220 [Vulcanisaeta souniana JCM 11219]